MDRVIVTGAAGFIGSHLSEHLLQAGHPVMGIDDFDPFYPRALKERNLSELAPYEGFEFHELDVRDTTGLAALLTSDSVVVHLAARPGVRPSIAQPMSYVDVNVGGTASVVEAMVAAGSTRLVFASSSSVYGDDTPAPYREDAVAITPLSPYAASKRAAELLLIAAAPLTGIRVAALRFFTVYGPRQRPDLAINTFVRRILDGQHLTLYGDGTQGRDYTYCSDVVAGIASAVRWTSTAEPGVECFNLGGSRVVTLRELVDGLAVALGVEPLVRWEPLPPGDVQLTSADLTKSHRELGYDPRVPLEEGLARFVSWYRSQRGPEVLT